MSHTPGPWEIDTQGDGIYGAQRTVHAARICTLTHHSRMEANARLIAAAPEMLEALKVARDILNFKGERNEIVDNAIAKAEGRE